MKVLILCWLALSAVSYANGLKCIACQGTKSFVECDITGRLQACLPNQESCETRVRRHGTQLLITKGCKNSFACKDNEYQNLAWSGRSSQCNSDQLNSVCVCWCDLDICNAGTPTCVKHYEEVGPGNDCPEVPTNFPHGEIDCSKDNKAGTVCQYKCTDKDYGVWPPNRKHNVCLRNGTWAREQPCCARPCPPYFLTDSVGLHHFSGENASQLLRNVMAARAWFSVSPDSRLLSDMYFSEEPRTETVIKFNDYGMDANQYIKLSEDRLKVINEGPVNLGAAMQYALDNLFTMEAGMRDSKVVKQFAICTDRNFNDDAKLPIAEALRRGIKIYVYGFETEGYTFDLEQLVKITGKKEHVFMFDQNFRPTKAYFSDVFEHFCQNPCEHVMHGHQ